MSGASIKNLVILILLLAVLFLLLLAVPQQLTLRSQAQTTAQLLQQLCREAGIALDADSLPQSQTLYELELNASEQAQLAIATILLGEDAAPQEDATRYLSVYTASTGSCSFSSGDGSFSASLNQGSEAGSQLTQYARELLSSLGYDPVDLTLSYASGQIQQVAATQQYYGVPVFSSGVTLTFVNERLIQIDGTFYVADDQPVRISESACISCADALVAFLGARDSIGWVGEEITTVTQGYIRSGISTNLTPVWRITTDTGVIEVNGITRAVSLVE